MRQITSPILLAAIALTLLNFYIVSEMATASHLATRQLENKIRSLNPMLLLQNKKLLQAKGILADAMGPSKAGEFASDVVVAMRNSRNQRLNVLLSKTLSADQKQLFASGTTLITGSAPEETTGFDHLMIEDVQQTRTPLEDLRKTFIRQGWHLKPDHLRLSLLMVRTRDLFRQVKEAKAQGQTAPKAQHYLNRCFTEISRRLSLSLSVFAFTLMGTSFGMSISRFPSKRKVAMAIGLVAFYLICFFTAKEMDSNILLSTTLYLAPIVLITLLSVAHLKKLTKGIE